MDATPAAVPLTRRLTTDAAVALALIALADWLFYEQSVGWTAGLYSLALIVALTLRSWRGVRGVRSVAGRSRAAWGLAAAGVGLAGAMAIEPGALSVTMAAAVVVMLATTLRGGWTPSVTWWAGHGAAFVLKGWTWLFADARRRQRAARRRSGVWVIVGVARWALPVSLTAVFVALFAAANPIIERITTDVGHWIEHVPRYVRIARVTLWIGVGVWVWALLRMRVNRPSRADEPARDALDDAAVAMLDPGTVVRCLVLFNAAFAVQTTLDAVYLLGGATLPDGLTYAQYAQRGAYPLIATALLAGLFVIVTFCRGARTPSMRTARVLVYVWLTQNVLLVGAAAWRLGLYVEAYSLTRWRLAAGLWMGLVALGLVWLFVRIVRDRTNAWLLRVNTLAAVGLLYACCFLNLDGAIARYNVRHCRETTGRGPVLDVAYLESLGPESLPALRWFAEHDLDESQASGVNFTRKRLTVVLEDQTPNWRGWTLQRQRLTAETVPVTDNERRAFERRYGRQREAVTR
ncbi:MAG: DUF4173 domain-containing protein [Phycisphaera sp.]|nr:DUF4173 domain-containing protein [Phycisphaera sp.]